MKNNTLVLVLAVLLGAGILGFVLHSKTIHRSQDWRGQTWNESPPLVNPQIQQNETKYQSALRLAKKEGKLVFLYFERDDCSWCRKMKLEVFSKPKVQKAFGAFVVCYINGSKEPILTQKYNVQIVPAYFVVTPNERVIKASSGYKKEAAFLGWLEGKKGLFR